MDSPAIKNLEFLRMLIAAARAGAPGEDASRLRMARYPEVVSARRPGEGQ